MKVPRLYLARKRREVPNDVELHDHRAERPSPQPSPAPVLTRRLEESILGRYLGADEAEQGPDGKWVANTLMVIIKRFCPGYSLGDMEVLHVRIADDIPNFRVIQVRRQRRADDWNQAVSENTDMAQRLG